MSQLRIKGLVRIMNEVRQRLAEGIPVSEAGEFREYVAATVAEVERICRDNRTSPDQLPAPTYRAYQFLKTLDLQNIVLIADDQRSPRRAPRIKKILSTCSALQAELDRLAQKTAVFTNYSNRRELEEVRLKIQTHADAVEQICEGAGVSPMALGLRSRRGYQWLKFLSDPLTLDLHLATLKSAHEVLVQINHGKQAGKSPEPSIRFELFPSSYLYRRLPKSTFDIFLFNIGFSGAPQGILNALVHIARGSQRAAYNQTVKAYAGSDDFAEIVQEVEFLGAEMDYFTQGRQYNLGEVFKRVNAEYFDDRLDRPQLTWNQRLSRYKFGHYQPTSDTVMISITLDDPHVPGYVIDSVMYHELLHKALGVKVINGRRYAHTPEFRREEKLFRRYEDAQAYLKQLANNKL